MATLLILLGWRLSWVWLVSLGLCSSACNVAESKPPNAGDWDTVYRGTGNVRARLESGYDDPIEVRFEDSYGRVIAQVVLPPRQAEIVYLSQGDVVITVRRFQSGLWSLIEHDRSHVWTPPPLQADAMDVKWSFFPNAR